MAIPLYGKCLYIHRNLKGTASSRFTGGQSLCSPQTTMQRYYGPMACPGDDVSSLTR